jgi:protein-S-isoprenylcysteine O-methyltransferase Ste14
MGLHALTSRFRVPAFGSQGKFMTVSSLLTLTIFLFPVSEVGLTIWRRASRSQDGSHDRGSMRILWLVITLSVTAAFVARGYGVGALRLATPALDELALALMLGGLAIRWAAILTLGRYFTVNVAISQGHQIIQSGLYRLVRHPSYSGLLLTFAGTGLSFHNWLSFLLLVTPITAAIRHRIRIEEQALLQAFGQDYADYSGRTWRLVPWLY